MDHKIKAAIVFVFAMGLGVGIPLLSRFSIKEIQANILQTGADQNNQSSTAPSTVEPFSCVATPSTVSAGGTVTWSIQTNNQNTGTLQYIWTGAVTGIGQTMTAQYSNSGNYTASVSSNDPQAGQQTTSCSVNVTATQSDNITSSLSSAADSLSTTPTTAALPTVENQQPAADILSCKLVNPSITISEGQVSIMHCRLKPPGIITATVIKGDYTPPADPDPTSIVKTFAVGKTTYDQNVDFTWNGIDNYDLNVPDGDYTFMVSARQNANANADISIQRVQVTQKAPINQTQEQSQTSVVQDTSSSPQQTQQTTSTITLETNPIATIPELNLDPVIPPPSAPTPPPPEPSKCPGLNYPNDIQNNWARDSIKIAFDNCIFRGYTDGNFHPDEPIKRAEAVKAVLISAGIPPKLGCYTLDCGTPFTDLLSWQSQWIRAAWDLKIVNGISEKLFAPQEVITRGQAVMLIAKAYKIQPQKDCFTPNCGAGHPNDFFTDITDPTMGSYLRPMWDLKIIQGIGPNSFDPNSPMSRGDMASLIVKTAQVLGKLNLANSVTQH